MALVTPSVVTADGTARVEATWDDVTGVVSQARWQNTGTKPAFVHVWDNTASVDILPVTTLQPGTALHTFTTNLPTINPAHDVRCQLGQ